MDSDNKQTYEFDIAHLLAIVWKKLWLVVVCCVVSAAIAFSYAKFFIKPTYSSSVMLYVNNQSAASQASQLTAGISSSDLSVAQKLVDTYIVILGSRTTIEKVIRSSGVSYTYEEMKEMITAEAVNSTEVFRVTVTTENAAVSKKIANVIASVLPNIISNIINGCSAKIVDKAVEDKTPVAPNYLLFGEIGAVVGFILAVMIILILDITDDIIRDEDYLVQNYDSPVLAVIPELSAESHGSYMKRYAAPNKNDGKVGK